MKTAWWWLIGLLVLLSVVLRHNLLFLMSLMLALVGGAASLWSRYCLRAVTYERRLGAPRLFYGEETTLDIAITNAKPLPLPWLRAEDEFPEHVGLAGGKTGYGFTAQRRALTNVISLRWYERVTRHYRLRATNRGAWQFGPVQLSAEDLFGFAVKNVVLDETQTLLVYPKIVPLAALGLPAHHPFGDFATPLRVIEDPLRLMGARAYSPGDNMRYIHWKASARRMDLQTKVFEPSASRPVAIFLNVNTFEHLWDGIDHDLQELAITAAASIARYAWEEGYPLGLYANSVTYPGGERIRIRPGTHADQLQWLLEALARVVEYGRFPIEAVIEVEATGLPYGSTCVVITTRVNDPLRQALLDLRLREHAVVLVTLGDDVDPAEPVAAGAHYHIGGREVWRELESLQLA